MKHIIEVERYQERSETRYLWRWRFVIKRRLRVTRGTTLHSGTTIYETIRSLSGFDSREKAIEAAEEQLNNGINTGFQDMRVTQ